MAENDQPRQQPKAPPPPRTPPPLRPPVPDYEKKNEPKPGERR